MRRPRLGSAKSTMTKRAVSQVAVDWQVETQDDGDGAALLDAMRRVWAGPARTMISDPQARILEAVDARDYQVATTLP